MNILRYSVVIAGAIFTLTSIVNFVYYYSLWCEVKKSKEILKNSLLASPALKRHLSEELEEYETLGVKRRRVKNQIRSFVLAVVGIFLLVVGYLLVP